MNKFGEGPSSVWPEDDLESVDVCPVCKSASRCLKHKAVQDWTFGSAPGLWSYWACNDCDSLYLKPRPTSSSIGRAYTSYYTHRPVPVDMGLRGLKLRWKNERLSLRLAQNILPRLNLPNWLHSWAKRKAQRMALSFGLEILASLSVGRFMDVGCGSGTVVALARQMGWDAEGLEFDSEAVTVARQAGLTILEGGYELLFERPESFDVLLCSHVIEHVHDPLDMLKAMHAALRPGGILLLSTPNAQSDVHRRFGPYWRGLEAPRHLMLFNEFALINLMKEAGFEVTSHADQLLETVKESRRIEISMVGGADNSDNRVDEVNQEISRSQGGHDFIKLSARKL